MTSDLRTEMQKRMDELVRGNANTPEQLLGPMRALLQIGRASCRERV